MDQKNNTSIASLLGKNEEVISDLITSLYLEDRSEREMQEIRDLIEESLSERINLFILDNLKGRQLSEYEKLLEEENLEPVMISTFLRVNINNFKEKITEDLYLFRQQCLNKYVYSN